MSAGVADGCGSHDWSSSIRDVLILLQECSDVSQAWLSVEPCSSVLWFLLSPAQLGILEVLHLSDDLLEGEWAQALNSEDGSVILALLCSGIIQVIVYLATAEDDFLHFLRSNEILVLIFDEAQESGGVSKIFNVGASSFVLEKLLWSNHNQWFSEWHPHVSSEHMEVVGSGGAIHHLHVDLLQDILVVIVDSVMGHEFILVTKLKVSLNSRR